MQIDSLQSAASEYEIKKWSAWFTEALQGQGQEAEQGYFWQYCEKDSNAVLNGCITGISKSEISLAELACGAGRVSISLAENPTITNMQHLGLQLHIKLYSDEKVFLVSRHDDFGTCHRVARVGFSVVVAGGSHDRERLWRGD